MLTDGSEVEPTTCLACCGECLCWVLLSTAQPGNSAAWTLPTGASSCIPETALLPARPASCTPCLSRSHPPHLFTGRVVASLATTNTKQRLETCPSFSVESRLYKELSTWGARKACSGPVWISLAGKRDVKEMLTFYGTFRRGLINA